MNKTNFDTQEELVQDFFNETAETYARKYDDFSVMHKYLFNQRLDLTFEKVTFENKRILDIGAGTGSVYDKILSENVPCDYWAIDIAQNMMTQSKIPEERQMVGNCFDFSFDKKYDIILMLGVSSYIDNENMDKIYEWVSQNLNSGGEFVITYSNNKSIGSKFFRTTKGIAKMLGAKGSVIGQDFKIRYRNEKDVLSNSIVKEQFKLKYKDFLNQTMFPFNHLFKSLSVKLAPKLKQTLPSGILKYFSADYFFIFELK